MNEDDIEIVIMNPECIPAVREKLFDFFYEKFVKEASNKNDNDLIKNNK